MRNAFSLSRGGREEKRGQHHEAVTLPDKLKITQSTFEVDQHHAAKTQKAARRFVVTEPVILIDKTRQHDAKKCVRGVHDRPFYPCGKREPDLEKRVLKGGLHATQQGKLTKLLGG